MRRDMLQHGCANQAYATLPPWSAAPSARVRFCTTFDRNLTGQGALLPQQCLGQVHDQ
jgi:hypothetical protein